MSRSRTLVVAFVCAAAVIGIGLWKLGGDDEWLALALYALGGWSLVMVGSAARTLSSGEG